MAEGKRRLAAILSADMVGYSRLMGADEDATIAALNACRTIFRDRIGAHHGRVVDTAGDSVLAVFDSVVESVRAADAIQNELAAENAGRPEDRRMQYRIGIHLGDIVEQADGTIYGDGVNVAARLESLGAPGTITLSEDAHRQVDGKIGLAFQDIGEHTVKNIARPVRAYRLGLDETAAEAADPPPALPDKPSIAVLPFDNLSGDPEQAFFADGIAEDLITALSRLRWLFVTGRNSSFTYRGQAVDLKQVGRDLGVRYILEGSVRKGGDRVRITAQLIDSATGNHLWAQRYDRVLEDIFAVQDEITETIAATLATEVGESERERARAKPPSNLDAWESYQHGLWHMWRYNAEHNAKARALLEAAIEKDANFASAHGALCYAHYLDVIMGFGTDPENSLKLSFEFGTRAVALDDKDDMAHAALGRAHTLSGNNDAAIGELEQALELNPNSVLAELGLGLAHNYAGHLEVAAEALNRAARLSPRDPIMWAIENVRAIVHFRMGKYELALKGASSAARRPNATWWPFAVLVAANGQLGRPDAAREAHAKLIEMVPNFSRTWYDRVARPGQAGNMTVEIENFFEGFEKAGIAVPD